MVFLIIYIVLNDHTVIMAYQPLKIIQNSQKQMPCNIEAEQALIGSILVSNEIYDEISLIIDFLTTSIRLR